MLMKENRIKLGLKLKFSLIISLVIISVGIIYGWYFISYAKRSLIDEIQKRGMLIAQNLAHNSLYGVVTEDKELLSEIINKAKDYPDISYVGIYTNKGDKLAEYYKDWDKRYIPHIPKEDILLSALRLYLYKKEIDGEETYMISAPIFFSVNNESIDSADNIRGVNKENFKGVAFVVLRLERINKKIGNVYKTTILITIGITLLFIFIAILVVGLFIRPIEAMTNIAAEITGGNLSKRIDITSEDEIGILGDAFNQMTCALEERMKEMKELNNTLEEKVRERTYEIENKNKELQETNISLREANLAKSKFLTNMSHELRTPLNSIIGFSRVLLKGIDGGEINEQQKNDLIIILNSGNHLLGLINDILDLSRIESGKTEFYREEIDIIKLIEGIMAVTRGLIKDKPIILKNEMKDDLPNVYADKTRLRQILLNLLSNASKFTDKGKISLNASFTDGMVQISVADTGIGIKKEDADDIFKDFVQVDNSTTRRYGGSGLGLSITKKFVEMHGGRIWMKSKYGEGSTFYFTIPAVTSRNIHDFDEAPET